MRIRPSRVGSPWFTYHILSLNEQKLLSKGSHELYRSLGFSWALSYFLRRCHGRAFGSMAIRGSSFRTESEGCPFRTIHFHLRGNVEKDLMDSRYYLHTLNFRGPQILGKVHHPVYYSILIPSHMDSSRSAPVDVTGSSLSTTDPINCCRF